MTLIALCQLNIGLGQLSQNLEKVRDAIASASGEGADLLVFPELSLTGYALEDDAMLQEIALHATNEMLQDLSQQCMQQGIVAVVGYVEKERDCYYNTAAIFGSGAEMLPRYRKIHLPAMGVDRYLTRGNLGFPIYDLSFATVGLNICYDQRFPESSRSLAVQGAQLVIVPTSENQARHEIIDMLTRVRAYENRVFYLWANRVGAENGSQYDGCSRIVDPFGNVLSLAGSLDEETIYCEIDPTQADDKTAFEDGEPSGNPPDLFNDRSPEDYQALLR